MIIDTFVFFDRSFYDESLLTICLSFEKRENFVFFFKIHLDKNFSRKTCLNDYSRLLQSDLFRIDLFIIGCLPLVLLTYYYLVNEEFENNGDRSAQFLHLIDRLFLFFMFQIHKLFTMATNNDFDLCEYLLKTLDERHI